MLLFMDGMAHYDTSRITAKWTAVDSTRCGYTVAAEGRYGNCLKRVSTANGGVPGYLDIAPLTTRLGPWVPTASGVCGFAVKVDDISRVDAPAANYEHTAFFVVMEGTNHHIKIDLETNGTFTLRQKVTSTGDLVLARSSEGLVSGSWMYVEIKWLLHPTAGNVQIRVNTVPVLNYTGTVYENDSFFSSLGVWNSVRVLGVTSTTAPFLTMRMCDFYLADLASAVAADVDDFLGDGVIATIFPNAVGFANAWTPDPSGPNWDLTNDKPAPDDAATQIRTATPGARDVYHFEDIPTGAIVLGAHYNAMVKKDAPGSVTVQPIVHQAGVNYDGPIQGVASETYNRYITQPYDLNPATLTAWTDVTINNGQFGLVKTT